MAEIKPLPSRRGLYFEAFETGQTYASDVRTVTEADVVAFATLTGDWNPIHTDADYAAQHPFGQRVAHGLLGLSIAGGLAARMGFLEETILAFREIAGWKFSLPIHLGDTIYVRASVTETKPVRRMDGGLVTFQVEVINQEEKIVQHGTWSLLMKSEPQESDA